MSKEAENNPYALRDFMSRLLGGEVVSVGLPKHKEYSYICIRTKDKTQIIIKIKIGELTEVDGIEEK